MEKKKPLDLSLHDLSINVSSLVQGELQGTNNMLELIEKMNLRREDEYNSFGDIVSGLQFYMEKLRMKNENFP